MTLLSTLLPQQPPTPKQTRLVTFAGGTLNREQHHASASERTRQQRENDTRRRREQRVLERGIERERAWRGRKG